MARLGEHPATQDLAGAGDSTESYNALQRRQIHLSDAVERLEIASEAMLRRLARSEADWPALVRHVEEYLYEYDLAECVVTTEPEELRLRLIAPTSRKEVLIDPLIAVKIGLVGHLGFRIPETLFRTLDIRIEWTDTAPVEAENEG